MKNVWHTSGRHGSSYCATCAAVLVVLVNMYAVGPAAGQDQRPNILFIMADDHTSQAFQSYGSRLSDVAPTPNINRLAQEGARLNNVFATNSICVPSRATILTGQYSHKNGAYTLRDTLDPQRPNVAKELSEAGYRTAVIGKWHLKSNPSGFDYYNVLRGQGDYFNPKLKNSRTGEYTEHAGYSADVIADLSLAWLEEQADQEDPFVLMAHFKACHEPFQHPERTAELFTDVLIPEPPSLWEDKSHRSPGSEPYGFTIQTMAHRLRQPSHGGWEPSPPLSQMSERQVKRHGYQRFLKRYLRCVAALDENVGRLLDYVDEAGPKDNTVVIYTSDQGYFLGEHNYIDKRWMYEESIRMPFLIRYPAEIEPGRVIDDLITNADFAPLMMDYAGLETPGYMQGRSFRPVLGDRPPTDWREAVYYRYWMHGDGARRPAHYGVRTDRHKLIFFYGLPLDQTDNAPTTPGWELYDLQKDPHEMDNVYEDPAYEETVEQLKDVLLEKKRQLDDRDANYPRLLNLRETYW